MRSASSRLRAFTLLLATRPALAAPHEQRPAACVLVGLGERERLVDAQAARQSTTINPRSRRPCTPSPAAGMRATISSTVSLLAPQPRPFSKNRNAPTCGVV